MAVVFGLVYFATGLLALLSTYCSIFQRSCNSFSKLSRRFFSRFEAFLPFLLDQASI